MEDPLELNRAVEWGPRIRPTRAVIDLGAIARNATRLAERACSPLLAVVKADAYGHGAVEVARHLATHPDVRGFAVSLVEEGIELRDAGLRAPILLMGPSLMHAHAEIVERELTPMLSDARHIDALAAAAQNAGRRLDVHLKFDTGMGRLGLACEAFDALVDAIHAHPALRVTGIASHLANADIDDPASENSATHVQLERFGALVERARAKLGPVSFHVANSAGLLRFAQSHADLARPGIALYGNGDDGGAGLEQAMSLRSEVTQLRSVACGDSVSYGGRWTATRDSSVAIVPVGYADGLPRNLTGKGRVGVRSRVAPIIGAVSMDMIVVDVTDLPEVVVGDAVTLLGSLDGDDNEDISVAEVARHAGISEYEVTCGISKRVPRVYEESDG